jgi:hypothetical protein
MNSSNRRSDFLDRFQGKTSQINKDGHIGVIERTGLPIQKPNMNNAMNSENHQMLIVSSSRQSDQIMTSDIPN